MQPERQRCSSHHCAHEDHGSAAGFSGVIGLGLALAGPPAPPTARLPLRVLVVEDSDDSREMLMALLRLWGHEAYEASDAETGLARCADVGPDVALIDVGLPGLDGYELARRIRAEPGRARVFLVAFTGYGRPEDQLRARESGFDAHLLKPVDPDVLRQFLDGRERHG